MISLLFDMQAATLETLVNLVAAGYGVTLIPALAAVVLFEPAAAHGLARRRKSRRPNDEIDVDAADDDDPTAHRPELMSR